jgi:hypothetical protein
MAPENYLSFESVAMGSRDVEETDEIRLLSTPSPPPSGHPPPIQNIVYDRTHSLSSSVITTSPDHYAHESLFFI